MKITLLKNTSVAILLLTGFLFFKSASAETIDLLPQFVGSTSPSSNITQKTYGKSVKITGLSTLSNICTDSNGYLTTSGCTGGSGSSGGTWSTTTTSGYLLNYSNNATDAIAVGSNSTTTAEFWYDPNTTTFFTAGKYGIGTTSPYAPLSVVGNGGVVAESFNATNTTATSTFQGSTKFGDRVLGYGMDFDNIWGVFQTFTLEFSIRGGGLTVGTTTHTLTNPTGNMGGNKLGVYGSATFGQGVEQVTAPPNGILVLGAGGFGTTTASYSKLSVWGGTTGRIFEVTTSASSSALWVSATGFGTTTVTGLAIVGSATSTSNVGVNLTAGCYAINGTCLTQNSGTVTNVTGSGNIASSGGTTPNITFTGTLPIANGGTNSSSISSRNLVWFDGTSILATSSILTVGSIISTTTATSTYTGGITANILNTSSTTASSTFANGINLTAGCFSVNGTCVTGGGASLTGGSPNTLTYWTSATGVGATSSPTIGYVTSTTTSTSTFTGGITANILNTSSTTASSTFSNGINLTKGCFSILGTCVGGSGGGGSGTVNTGAYGQYAWYAADGTAVSATGTQLTVGNILATSTTATSTFIGDTVTNGLYAGPASFPNDAGTINGLDMQIVSATNNTVESYNLNLDSSTTPPLTVYGLSDGAGGLKIARIGIASTTPWRTLDINGTVGMKGLTGSSGLQVGILCLSSVNEVINESVACVASAERYKENIKALTVGIDELMKLRPVSFTWKKDYNGSLQSDPNKSGTQYSLIADQVQQIDPNLTSVTLSTTTFEGKTYPPGTVQGLQDSNHWTALLVKSIQDIWNKVVGHDKRIEDLEKKNAELEARLLKLENK